MGIIDLKNSRTISGKISPYVGYVTKSGKQVLRTHIIALIFTIVFPSGKMPSFLQSNYSLSGSSRKGNLHFYKIQLFPQRADKEIEM